MLSAHGAASRVFPQTDQTSALQPGKTAQPPQAACKCETLSSSYTFGLPWFEAIDLIHSLEPWSVGPSSSGMVLLA